MAAVKAAACSVQSRQCTLRIRFRLTFTPGWPTGADRRAHLMTTWTLCLKPPWYQAFSVRDSTCIRSQAWWTWTWMGALGLAWGPLDLRCRGSSDEHLSQGTRQEYNPLQGMIQGASPGPAPNPWAAPHPTPEHAPRAPGRPTHLQHPNAEHPPLEHALHLRAQQPVGAVGGAMEVRLESLLHLAGLEGQVGQLQQVGGWVGGWGR